MNQGLYRVQSNVQLTSTVYRMVVEGDTSSLSRPGQFVNFKIDGLYLRRPISVCDYDHNAGTITLIYKVVGAGTESWPRPRRATYSTCFRVLETAMTQAQAAPLPC